MCHSASNAEELMDKIWRDPCSEDQLLPPPGKWSYWITGLLLDLAVHVLFQTNDSVMGIISIKRDGAGFQFYNLDGHNFETAALAFASLGLRFSNYNAYTIPTMPLAKY